jgi:hypothetical protein
MAVFSVVYESFAYLGGIQGILAYIDYGRSVTVSYYGYGRDVVETEENGAFTIFGQIALVLSAMVGARLGMAVFHRSVMGGVSPSGNAQFLAWFFGLLSFLIVVVLGEVIFGAYQGNGGLRAIGGTLVVILGYGIYWASHRWYVGALKRIRQSGSEGE